MPHQPRKLFKFICLLLSFCFIFEQTGFAQVAPSLDISARLSLLHRNLTADKFRPLHLRYLQYLPSGNSFNLLIDKGSNINPKAQELESTSKELLKYFFIGLTLPNNVFWVNLRPDSPDNIIDDSLAQTDIGRVLLEADLELKKDTARATSPENPEGRVYWSKLYEKAGELFGNGNITIPTLTRPWIVPDEIIIRETSDSAYVYKATLKVMLEQDYLKNDATYKFDDERFKQLNDYSSQLIRELIIPKLTKEINTSKKYAPLRQIYYSLILAQWFKSRFKNQNTQYSQIIDRYNLTNLTSSQSYSKNTYFQAYQKSFKDGEYNINEPVQTPFGQTVRSYFSGGFQAGELVPQNPGTSAPTLGGGTTMRMSAQDNSARISNPYLAAAEGKITLGELVVKVSDTQLSEEEVQQRVKAIEASHQVEPERQLGEQNPDGTYEKYTSEDPEDAKNKAYTPGGISKKARILRDGGFSQDQRNNLIKYGIAGNTGKSIVKELAADTQKLTELTTKYRQLYKEIVAEVVRQHQQRGAADFVFTRDYSLGAQGAVKLKIFELLAKGGFSEQDITGFITRDFLPALKEEQMGALLPVGTEVEVWNKAPYTDAAFYPRSTVVEIWGNILGLPFGMDELVEFALPPSLSGNSQVAMIDSMVELGLIPQGWFSLHISGALPLKANHQHLLDQLASYLEMTKAILYTSDERIDYFADQWNPLAVKGGAGNVSKTQGKKPSFAIYADEDEMTRLEYRSGDVVVPGLAYQGAIPFIQNTHSLMFLALVAAIDSGSIKNKLMEDLLVAFDTFITDIDTWAELIKDTHSQLKSLFGGNLFQNVIAIKEIIELRKASPELIEALRAIVLSLQERLRVILANAERTKDLPADTKRIDNLEIIKRLRKGVPKIEDLKDIFMNLPMRNIDFGGLTERNPRDSGPSGSGVGPGGAGDYRDEIRRWINDPRNFRNFAPINRESYYINSSISEHTHFEIPQINSELFRFQIKQEDMIIFHRQPKGFLARLWDKVQAVLIAAHNWLAPFLVPLFPGIELFPNLFNVKGVQTEFQNKFWDALDENRRVAKHSNSDLDNPVVRRVLVNQALRDILNGLPADRVESLRKDFWKAVDLMMRQPKAVSQKQAFNFALTIIEWKMKNPPAPGASPSLGGDLGASSSSTESVGMKRLKRLLETVRGNLVAPGLAARASDAQVMEHLIKELESIFNGLGAAGIISRSEDNQGNVVITIDADQAEAILSSLDKDSQEAKVLRRLLTAFGLVTQTRDGVEAINFRDSDGNWVIVGFKEQLDIRWNLDHEQREIALRKRGFLPANAHALVIRNKDSDEAEIQAALARQTEGVEESGDLLSPALEKKLQQHIATFSDRVKVSGATLEVIDEAFYELEKFLYEILRDALPEARDDIYSRIKILRSELAQVMLSYGYLVALTGQNMEIKLEAPETFRLFNVYPIVKSEKVSTSQGVINVFYVRNSITPDYQGSVTGSASLSSDLVIIFTEIMRSDVEKDLSILNNNYSFFSRSPFRPDQALLKRMADICSNVYKLSGRDSNSLLSAAEAYVLVHEVEHIVRSRTVRIGPGDMYMPDLEDVLAILKGIKDGHTIGFATAVSGSINGVGVYLRVLMNMAGISRGGTAYDLADWLERVMHSENPEQAIREAASRAYDEADRFWQQKYAYKFNDRPSDYSEDVSGLLGSLRKSDQLEGKSIEPAVAKTMGGIDFSSLPIVTQAVSNLRAPISADSLGALQRMNLSEEWNQIEQMSAGGITPSAERIKEFIQASCVQGSVEKDAQKVVSCIADILRQEEEGCCSTDAALKDILVILEAAPSQSTLSKVFL